MVDFNRRLGRTQAHKPTNPLEIYEGLDRASDKGPLRAAQSAVLGEWYAAYRTRRDVILKLHTGQGKTLIGLLLLQSKLNESNGRALYLCPNRHLVQQTASQARQFGVNTVTATGELPESFENGQAILVTTVQKLFNGLSRFGLGTQSLPVASVVLDDSHACIDAIKDAFTIHLDRNHVVYTKLVILFGPELEMQGAGTYAELKRATSGSFLPVPYWDWLDKLPQVVELLSENATDDALKFHWPILKDSLDRCLCVISGDGVEISPFHPPLHMFGSFDRATHRVFMSASASDDAFLLKGFGLTRESIEDPLVYREERWSGEKMVLIPSLVDSVLSEEVVIKQFAKGGPAGIVALCPSFAIARRWEDHGALVARKDQIEALLETQRAGGERKTLAIANRYNGIDLPDAACRVLILHGLPYSESLRDNYMESCLEGSPLTLKRTARDIEQGMGRAVRGEKDYCIVLLLGAGLVRLVRSIETQRLFSAQTRRQIQIGLEIAELAQEDDLDKTAMRKLLDLVLQCLKRDDGWKNFYVERMNEVEDRDVGSPILDIFAREQEAERHFERGDCAAAVQAIQSLLDSQTWTAFERGWYLQEMAKFMFPAERAKAEEYQAAAHRANRYVLRPRQGTVVSKVTMVSQRRVKNINAWVARCESHAEVMLKLEEILSNLRFGVKADHFERAVQSLGEALGYAGDRPDKEWKAGPDNLWALRDGEYLLIECKNEVDANRSSISKSETGQMNNSCAWFEREYHGAKAWRWLVIPTKQLSKAAGFTSEVSILRERGLRRLVENVRAFFREFRSLDVKELTDAGTQSLLGTHMLTTDEIVVLYTEKPVPA